MALIVDAEVSNGATYATDEASALLNADANVSSSQPDLGNFWLLVGGPSSSGARRRVSCHVYMKGFWRHY